MEIRFTFDDQLSPAIERALAACHDFTPAMDAVADVMRQGVLRRFEAGEAPDGTPWKPSQRVVERGGETLIDTRRLISSITRDHDATSAVVGTNVVYAAIHQLGGTIRAIPKSKGGKGYLWVKGKTRANGKRLTVASVNMPARPFLGFGDTELREIPEIIGDHLRAAFAGQP